MRPGIIVYLSKVLLRLESKSEEAVDAHCSEMGLPLLARGAVA